MSALETFCFGAYTLRPAGMDWLDLTLAERWTAADLEHAGRFDPRFWLIQGMRMDAWLLSDRGGPIFFLKIVGSGPIPWRADYAELFIQFKPPPADRLERLRHLQRTQAALILGLEWLERILRQSRVKEIFFDSRSEMLIRFSVEKLGFERQAAKDGFARLTKKIEPEAARR